MILGLDTVSNPTLICMVGFPGTGKSTLAKRIQSTIGDVPVLSTDDYVEKKAKELGLSYDETWSDYIDEATKDMNEVMQLTMKMRKTFIVDRTNLSAKRRQKLLRGLPMGYQSIAVLVGEPSDEEWKERLESRPGKHITMAMIDNMREFYTPPSILEGWTCILKDRF